ncbi:MAG: indole-3-glycerol-phosphate synthase TrpC, partial [Spirochaetes bacterium]|nr:indole-3-glycerol-phosphate synthase TrpC [Spirochaetota bacterium]
MKENILQKIVRTKQGELEKLRKRYGDISKKPDQKKRSGFKKNFTGIKRVKIIAEIKPASPSEGVIFDPTEKKIKEIASLYAKYPIGAVSVLTDQEFFHGA